MPYDPNKSEERLLIVADTFASLIAQSAYFAGAPAIPVITERKGDINAEISKALAQLGLCVVVVTPDGDSLHPAGDGISLRVRLVAEISENVLINQSKSANNYRPALGAAVAVMKAVDRRPNGLDIAGARHERGLNEFTLPTDEPPYRLVPAPRPTYHVTAYTTVEL
jgi:hypothetical protein